QRHHRAGVRGARQRDHADEPAAAAAQRALQRGSDARTDRRDRRARHAQALLRVGAFARPLRRQGHHAVRAGHRPGAGPRGHPPATLRVRKGPARLPHNERGAGLPGISDERSARRHRSGPAGAWRTAA
ncbi:hypothetical protein OY671_011907, partial [Metschnikowia pulcherrima]